MNVKVFFFTTAPSRDGNIKTQTHRLQLLEPTCYENLNFQSKISIKLFEKKNNWKKNLLKIDKNF